MSTQHVTPYGQRTQPRGLRPDIYASPRTPSTASSANLGRSTSHSQIRRSGGSRKRTRSIAGNRDSTTSYSASRRSYNGTARINHADQHLDTTPAPLANSRYRLAGGLDTPTTAAASQYDSLAPGPETDFRRRWTTDGVDEGIRVYSLQGLDRERNGRGLSSNAADVTAETWADYVYRVAGGLAGSVWQFCRDNAFKGFTAGGGQGYAMTDSGPRRVDGTPRRRPLQDNDQGTPVPGQFPLDEYDNINYSSADDTEDRPAKRLQTSQRGDWVMVNQGSASMASPNRQSTLQPAPVISPSRSYVPRPVTSRAASARRPRPSAARLSSAASPNTPQYDKGRSASYASPRSPATSTGKQSSKTSPVSEEVQRYAARKERQERQADASMRKLNQQLKAMIREGKEALATKVDIDDDDLMLDDLEDEGFAEGDLDGGGKFR